MLRFKLKNGGEVNFFAHKILSFIKKDDGSEIVLDGGLTYQVNESPQSIRNAIKKLDSEE